MTARERCLEATKRPNGVTATEMAPMPRTTASVAFRWLASAGLVFKGGTHMEMRYFDNPEAARAFQARMRVDRAPAKRAYVAMGNPVRGRGPAFLPGEPIRTKHTKVTKAPTPPRSLRTNTYSIF